MRHFTIQVQENAQNMPRYYTVKLCIALQNLGFTGFLAEGLEIPNFDVIFSSGIIKLSFEGLTYNTCGHFAHFFYFSEPRRGSEKYYATRKISGRIIC